MIRVTFSPEARLDLIEITDYLADVAGPRVARRYENEIKRLIDNLHGFAAYGLPSTRART